MYYCNFFLRREQTTPNHKERKTGLFLLLSYSIRIEKIGRRGRKTGNFDCWLSRDCLARWDSSKKERIVFCYRPFSCSCVVKFSMGRCAFCSFVGLVVIHALVSQGGGVVSGSSLHLAELCRGHRCSTAGHPILDYSEKEGCHCTAHPCWHDDGESHHCDNSPDHPFLMFSYSTDGKLECSCSKHPHYDSTHIAKTKCPGQFCDDKEKTPIMDWDEKQQKCICRSHPCWNLDGQKHECKDPKHPILYYAEDAPSEENGFKAVPRCTCISKFSNDAKEEL